MCESNLFGQREAYYLKDAPFCVPQGIIVEEQFMPYVYIPGLLPFHVTDCSKLKVTCPEKYRKYADRVDDYIPIFKENLRISVNQKTGRSKIAPARSKAGGVEVLPDVPLLDEDVVIANDPTVNYRRMTKEALIAEAQSERHQATHFPHNPWCPT